MLTIAKIHSEASQARGRSAAGYLHYLGKAPGRERGFEAYAEGRGDGPGPFWAGRGPELLGLGQQAEREHIERLARGLHPLTGDPLVKGAGRSHVMGLDMTFSAPKDFSALFAAADEATREAMLGALRESAKAALAYAESATLTRHGAGGAEKRHAEAAAAACFQHFASRAGQPNLHVHALLMNAAKRADGGGWSSAEQRNQFDRKMATGALFRAELARRTAELGFAVVPDGPFFNIRGVDERQRQALSDRSREIDERLRAEGLDPRDSAARRRAALSTRAAKAEPPLPELLARFSEMARELGLDAAAAKALGAEREPEFELDREALLEELTRERPCVVAHQALALICERSMGRWGAARCRAELDALLASDAVVTLGRDELTAEVFTSKAARDLEAGIEARVAAGKSSRAHAVDPELVDAEFDRLEAELRAKLGIEASLAQQRAAAMHMACGTGLHAFVEGRAGAGKTTAMRACAKAWEAAGLEVRGCAQSAAAAQCLSREAGIPSRTIASLLLAESGEGPRLTERTVLVLDESGMVGSREFGLLQEACARAGAKLVCVGDPRQLQPIEGGGICASLARLHGKAELSNIQRQRTDFEPLLAWLARRPEGRGRLEAGKAEALRALPEDARTGALEALCQADAKLSRAFGRWRARFDHRWMREAVEAFAKGEAREALSLLDVRGALRLAGSREAALSELMEAWAADRAPIERKLVVAATRADVAEINARARAWLAQRGLVRDDLGIEAEIVRRDGSSATSRFAPGDRIAFTMNDAGLGVANGAAGTVAAIEPGADPRLSVVLDEPGTRGRRVSVPASFARFDHAYCLTNHKAQGRTVDSARVFVNPSMLDREWIYVAASRSRFATTLHVDASALRPSDPEAHAPHEDGPLERARAIDALAVRMSRSRAKATTLDFERPEGAAPARGQPAQASARPARVDHGAGARAEAPDPRRDADGREHATGFGAGVATRFARRLAELARQLAPSLERGR